MTNIYLLTEDLPKTEENLKFCEDLVERINSDHPHSAFMETLADVMRVKITSEYKIMCEMYVRDHCNIKVEVEIAA